MPTEILPAVPHALGQVTSRQNQLVTVQFANTESNPTELHNATRKFKVDVGQQEFHVGDWVVANWKRAPRTDKATGALLVQGSVGDGCHLRSLPRAAGEQGLQAFLQHSASQLSSQLEQRNQLPQNKPEGPDPSDFLSVIDPSVAGRSVNGSTPPWLPVAVPTLGVENEWGLPESYVRIGYVSFSVDSPVEEIRIEEASPARSIQTLRSRTAIQKDNWHAQQQVTITLTLHGLKAINEVLLPLVRLFKKAPFLPVFNRLLFEANITALSLQSLQTSTIPGYPNALKAVLVCWAFNWEAYLPLASEANGAHGMDSLFCYPLLKIWAEKPDPHIFSPKKMARQWDGKFRMYHPDEDWLKQTSEFPSIAARWKSLNNDLDVIEQASLWSTEHGLADESGFKQTSLAANLGGLQVGSTRTMTLASPAGRMVIGKSSYTFVRITDPALARKIASSADCVKVLKGEVNVAQYLGMAPGISPMTPSLVNFNEVKGGPSQLVSLIDQNDKTTLDYLKAGNYTFMVHMHSPLFTTVARQQRPKTPVAPSDQPVPDITHECIPPSMVIEQISCSMDNIIVPLQVRGKESATHQYMGSNCLSFQVVGTLEHYEDLHQIKSFIERVHELGRGYKGIFDGKPFGGFCMVDNEILQMMGVRFVLPISWEATTIPDFPGALRFVMTLVEFDVTQRRKENLGDLMTGVIRNPLLSIRSDHDTIEVDWIRQRDLNRRLRAVELYPDLALPLHTELAQWITDIKTEKVWDWQNARPFPAYSYLDPDEGGTGWQWAQQDRQNSDGVKIAARLPDAFLAMKLPSTHPERFADPDFYCSPSQKWGVEILEGMMDGTKVSPVVLHDSYGTHVEILPSQHLNTDLMKQKGSDPQNTIDDGHAAASDPKAIKVPPIGASTSLVDQALSGVLPGVPTDSAAPSDVPARLANGTGALIPIVPDSNNVKKGGTRPRVAADDSGTMTDRYNRYAPVAAAAAAAYGIDPALFFAQIEQESQWKASATNGPGRGIAQIEPPAQHDLGLTDAQVFDPTEALFAAARYYRQMLNQFNGDKNLALAAYNEGAGATKAALRKTGLPTPKGQKYINDVQSHVWRYISAPNAPTGLGSTAGWLAQPAFDPLIKLQTSQLQRQFNSGYTYSVSDLAPYLIPDTANESWLGKMLDKLDGFDPKKQFIPHFWLRVAATTSTHSELGPGTEVPSQYQIKGQFLPQFLAECKKRHLQFSIITSEPTVVPGKYAYEEGYDTLPYNPPTIQQSFHDPVNQRDIWHDMREELICGRLLGAFPTFYVALIDGGRRMRIYRMFDHVYGMQAVTQIAVHRTRKGPVETAVVNFSNMYGHLTAQAADQARINSLDTRGTWGLEAVLRGFSSFVQIDDETLVEWAQQVETLFLKPGARLHIRMGYGSDCSKLPVVFNGTISEVPLSEGEVQVVALSDGIELVNDLAPTDLQGSMPVYRLNGFLGEGMNPREIITTFMAPNPTLTFVGNVIGQSLQGLGFQSLGGLFYNQTSNQYGIEHFGSPIRSQLGFDDGEVGVNLYNPESSAPYSQSSAWDNTLRIFQFWRWDKNKGLIGINMAQATPWQIFETCRKTIPDYLLYSSPFETRSTLFMGKGWFPLFYAYKEDLPEFTPDVLTELPREALMEWKPFQQVHLITSDWNLLGTDVRADESQMATQVQAVGTYNGWLPGADLSNEASFVMMLDSDIWVEKQKLKIVESGLYADVNMKLGDANSDEGGPTRVLMGAIMTALGVATADIPATIAGLAQLAEGPIRSFMLSRRVEDYFAAATLKDYVKDMYQGCLTLFGNPYIKPFDLLTVADNLSGLNGMCETKTVTHTMSLDTGFVTVVEPDCISTFLDFEGRDLYLWAMMAGSHLVAAYAIAAALGALARKGSTAFLLRGIRRLSKWVGSEARRLATGRGATSELFKGKTPAEAEALANDLKLEVEDTVQAVRQNNPTKLRAVLEALVDKNGTLRAVVDAAPKDIGYEIRIQSAIRGLPQTEGAKTVVKFAGKQVDNAKAVFNEKVNQNLESLDRLTQELEAKHGELNAFGKSPEEITQLIKQSKEGVVLENDDAKIVKIAGEIASLENEWKVSAFARSALKAVPETGELLGTVAKGLFTKGNVLVALTSVANIGMGCLSDYVTRALAARQCLTVFPLKIYGLNLEAGINGHRGAVAGDRIGQLDQFIMGATNLWGLPYGNLIAPFVPILGDVVTSGLDYHAPATPSFINDNTTTR